MIRIGHHHEAAAGILRILKAYPFDEAISILAIVCRCVTDHDINGRFWAKERQS